MQTCPLTPAHALYGTSSYLPSISLESEFAFPASVQLSLQAPVPESPLLLHEVSFPWSCSHVPAKPAPGCPKSPLTSGSETQLCLDSPLLPVSPQK